MDIISTYYRQEEGNLYSERIITAREIIKLEGGGKHYMETGGITGDLFMPEGISGTGTAADMGNILVMTLFLTDTEVIRSFTALERGMLFVALCPEYETGGN